MIKSVLALIWNKTVIYLITLYNMSWWCHKLIDDDNGGFSQGFLMQGPKLTFWRGRQVATKQIFSVDLDT